MKIILKIKNSIKKPALILAAILAVFFLYTGTGLSARIPLPSWLPEALRDFFERNPDFSMEPYKDGTIILVKPVATGVGEGRYEAGDIVEIRDGSKPLGREERTQLLPLYYPGKIDEKLKEELMKPISDPNDTNEHPNDLNVTPPQPSPSKGEGASVSSPSFEGGEREGVIVARRSYGVDYTKFLSGREILKVRRFEPLKKLPEIDLNVIINKGNTSDMSYTTNRSYSAVQLPRFLAFAEKTLNSISWLAQSFSKPVFADGETVKIVDPGNGTGTDYVSLNAWEAAMQANITAAGTDTISVAKLRATSGTPDTTTVTINGWTTDATHYIKIWTDPNESFRHSGVWDDTKYRLVVTDSYGFFNVEDYVRIDGVQIRKTSSSGNDQACFYSGILGASTEIWLSNIICDQAGNDSYREPGFYISGATAKIWNVIIYGLGAAISSTNAAITGNGTWSIYNSTLIGNYMGLRVSSGNTVTAKNVYAAGSSAAFSVDGTLNQTTCASSDATADGTALDNISTSTINFIDNTPGSENWRIPETSALKGVGTDTSSEAEPLNFTTDIEGQTRSGSWDIGADQFAATPIYRSTGFNSTTAIASSTGATLTISGSSATFSSGMPANMGVGDVIVYQSLNGTTKDSLAFVHGRANETTYTVKDKEGHIASSTSATANWQVFRAYASLSKAESGDENDGLPDSLEAFETWSGGKNLASSTEQWNIAAYADAADTTGTMISGWTTASSTYIRIFAPYQTSEVGTSQRHNGKWDSTKYYMQGSANMIEIRAGNVDIDGIQIYFNSPSSNNNAILVQGLSSTIVTRFNISNNIVKGTGSNVTGAPWAIAMYDAGLAGSVSNVWNNLVYDMNGSGTITAGFYLGDANQTGYFYNNTAVNVRYCYQRANGTFIAKNNIAQNCYDSYVGTFSASGSNNISGPDSDAQMPSANAKKGVLVNFVDSANNDFHLSPSDVWAKDNGADLSGDANLAYKTDIDGEERPGGTSWDIGADESKAAAQIGKPQTNLLNDDSLVGYWSFDGADMNWASTTAEALDRSGNDNNGDVVNFTKTSVIDGISGQGLRFDGADDYIRVPDSDELDGTGTMSWSFWMKSSASPIHVFDKYVTVAGGRSYNMSLTLQAGTYDLSLQISSDGTNNQQVECESDISPGQWTHVAVVFDNGSWNVYRNNTKITCSNFTTHTSIYGGTAFLDVIVSTFNGLADEARIYNRVLSPAEITQLYNAGIAKLKVATPPGSGAAGLSSGLVGYWSFDGPDMNWGATATAYDRSGSSPANNGTITNMSPSSVADGKIGQGLSFDGTDDKVGISPQTSINDLSTMTVSAWINAKSYGEGNAYIISKEYNFGDGWWLSLSPSYKNFNFTVDYDGATDLNGYSANNSFTSSDLNKWVHVVMTWDGANLASGVSFYKNGVKSNNYSAIETNGAGSRALDTTRQLQIGNAYFQGRTFDGLIDEVRIYNRALSASEIQALYQQGSIKAKFKKN